MTSTTYTYPIFEPTNLVAGDNWIWYRNLDYLQVDPTDWVLSYSFVPITTGNAVINITAADNGDGTFVTNVLAATTKNYTPDTYIWQAYATDVSTGLERHTLYNGQSIVVINFATAPQQDNRSGVKKTLDALEALIAGKLSIDQQNISVAGRSISKMPLKDVIEALTYYKELYAKELQEVREGQKRVGPSKILTSFTSGSSFNPKNWLTQ